MRSLRKHDAMRIFKTWVNSWATSSRFHEAVQLPCLFGCADGLDQQSHYAMCPILFHLTAQCIHVSEWPLERIGLCNPCSQSLKAVACVFSAYHAVKRSTIVKSLGESGSLEQPRLENDQCLIIHGLFADTLWVEANEVRLSPTRFRPCINSVWHTRRGSESVGSNHHLL